MIVFCTKWIHVSRFHNQQWNATIDNILKFFTVWLKKLHSLSGCDILKCGRIHIWKNPYGRIHCLLERIFSHFRPTCCFGYKHLLLSNGSFSNNLLFQLYSELILSMHPPFCQPLSLLVKGLKFYSMTETKIHIVKSFPNCRWKVSQTVGTGLTRVLVVNLQNILIVSTRFQH